MEWISAEEVHGGRSCLQNFQELLANKAKEVMGSVRRLYI